jgi:hypothetical protein
LNQKVRGRVGYAVPGQDIVQNPVVSYVLKDESTRRATKGITAIEDLRRLGLIVVKEWRESAGKAAN